MKNILITGGAGFIGSHLVDHLLTDPRHRVTVVDNFNDFYDPLIKRRNVAEHLDHPNYRLVEAEITDRPSLDRLFADADFDTVVHLAARAGVRPSLEDPLEYEWTNSAGTS